MKADNISYHTANFRKNATNSTVDMGLRRGVAFSLLHPAQFCIPTGTVKSGFET
jgi:hypothetical protein